MHIENGTRAPDAPVAGATQSRWRPRTEMPAPARRGGGAARWIGRLALFAVGLAAGWAGARQSLASQTTAAPRLETAIAGRRDIGATVLATGVVRPTVGAQVAVGSRASGILKKLHVTVGDRVRAGQLLAELDDVELRTQVARADAARSSMATERAWAEEEHGRVRQLATQGMAAPAALSAAKRAMETAQAREREAAAALESTRVQLGFTRIHAPIAGVVGSVATQEGETVAASFASPTFLTIVDLARLQVWAYVDETDVGRIAVGQRATFTVDTWPDERFQGRVIAVRPIAELRDNVVNYVTLIEIDRASAAGRLLRPEMTTTVNIVLDGRSDVLSMPNGALRRDAEGSYVLVPTSSGTERRAVRVGFRGSAFSEVVGGLREGDRVVLGTGQNCEPAPAAPAVTLRRPGGGA